MNATNAFLQTRWLWSVNVMAESERGSAVTTADLSSTLGFGPWQLEQTRTKGDRNEPKSIERKVGSSKQRCSATRSIRNTPPKNDVGCFDIEGATVKRENVAILGFVKRVLGYDAEPIKAAENLLVELKGGSINTE